MLPWKRIYVYFFLVSFSNAVLKTKPKNTVSLKGKRVVFECRSHLQNLIDWSFTSVSSPATQQFYFNGKFYPKSSSSRYKVLRNESGQCDLIIDSVDFSYAGNYKCSPRTTENKQSHQWHSVELVVLDSDPICKANSLDDSEEYEIIKSECQINYRGNAKPRMECTANDDRATIDRTLSVNYSDSTYRDNTTLTNITSSVMTSSVTIPKVQSANITCNITFKLISSSNIDDHFEYFQLWTYAPNHRSKGNAEGEGKASSDSPPNITIVVCFIGILCFAIVLLILLRRNFCSHQKKKNRHSEPDVPVAMQSYKQSVQYEEVQLPYLPDAPPSDIQDIDTKLQLKAIVSVADANLNQSTPNAVKDGEERTSDDIRNNSSSNTNETAYEKLARMEALGPVDEHQKMYSSLHIYANTILKTDYENQL